MLRQSSMKVMHMKQMIDSAQLDEITEVQRNAIRDWWTPAEGDWIASKGNSRQKKWHTELNSDDTDYGFAYEPGVKVKDKNIVPLLSIGQMIEFLRCKGELGQILYLIGWTGQYAQWRVTNREGVPCLNTNHPQMGVDFLELCDALWEAVKKTL